MDSQNIDNNEIGLSQGSLNYRMKVKPLVPGELFYNYTKTDLLSDKIVGNPYELWIGTTNPTKPVRIGAQGSLIIYGNYRSFFEVFQNNGPLSQYPYSATLPANGTKGLAAGNVYKIDKDIIIYATDTTPQFVGGDFAVYLGDNKWWNLSNTQLVDDIYYRPCERGDAVEDSDYEYTDNLTKSVKTALDVLYQSKAGLGPDGKLYLSEIPDKLLKKWSNNLVEGPFEVQSDTGYNRHDTFGVNPRYGEYVSSNGTNRMEPHSVNVKGNFNVSSFQSSLVFGDTSDTRVLGIPGTNKLFGMPFNYALKGFSPLGQDVGSGTIERDLTVGRTIRTKNMFYSDIVSNGVLAIVKNHLVTNNDLLIGKAKFDAYSLDEINNLADLPTYINVGDSINASSDQADINYTKYNITSSETTCNLDSVQLTSKAIVLDGSPSITSTLGDIVQTSKNITQTAKDIAITADNLTLNVPAMTINPINITASDVDLVSKAAIDLTAATDITLNATKDISLSGANRTETFTGITTITKPNVWSFNDNNDQMSLTCTNPISTISEKSITVATRTTSTKISTSSFDIIAPVTTINKILKLGVNGNFVEIDPAKRIIRLNDGTNEVCAIRNENSADENDLILSVKGDNPIVKASAKTGNASYTNTLVDKTGTAKFINAQAGNLSVFPSTSSYSLGTPATFSASARKTFFNVNAGSTSATAYLLLNTTGETSKIVNLKCLAMSSNRETLVDVFITNNKLSFTSRKNSESNYVTPAAVTCTYKDISYYAIQMTPNNNTTFTYYIEGTSSSTSDYTGAVVTDVSNVTAYTQSAFSLALGGSLSTDSLSTGKVNCSSVASTGDISGNNISSSGNLTVDGTATVTGKLQVGSIEVGTGKIPLLGTYSNGRLVLDIQ